MINPYQNNAQSMQVGNLIIENQEDKISIYGDIDVYQNAQGLKNAKMLQALFTDIVQALEKQETTANKEPDSTANLPNSPKRVTNPFV